MSKITTDDAYELIERADKIHWNGRWYNIIFHNEDIFVLSDVETGNNSDEIPYEWLAEALNGKKEKFEFYELKKIEVK